VQPLGQEIVGIDTLRTADFNPRAGQGQLQLTSLEGIESLAAATDELTTDENLWDSRHASSGDQRGTYLTTPVMLLVGRRVNIDRVVINAEVGEQFAY